MPYNQESYIPGYEAGARHSGGGGNPIKVKNGCPTKNLGHDGQSNDGSYNNSDASGLSGNQGQECQRGKRCFKSSIRKKYMETLRKMRVILIGIPDLMQYALLRHRTTIMRLLDLWKME